MATLEVELSSGTKHRIPLSTDADPDAELLKFVAGGLTYRGHHGWIQTETGEYVQVAAIVSVQVDHSDGGEPLIRFTAVSEPTRVRPT